MTRRVKDAQLDSPTARERLKARAKPYYKSLAQGLHIGYRKNKNGGVWVARIYTGDQVYKVESIGTSDDKLKADGVSVLDFDQAQDKAREQRKKHNAPIQSQSIVTVREAVEKYIQKRDARDSRRRGQTARSDASQRLTRYVLGQPARGNGDAVPAAALSEVMLRELNEDDLGGWRAGLPDALKETTKRRLVADLKAALNDQIKLLPISLVLRTALKSDVAEDSAEPVARDNQILSDPQIVQLLRAAREVDAEQDWDGDLFRLVVVMNATGARFSQVARMKVRDCQLSEARLLVPSSRKGGGGGKASAITIPVEPAVIDALRPVAIGRSGGEPLLERFRLKQATGGATRWVRAGRGPWQKASEFDRAWRVVRTRSGMPDVIPYALRHSSIVRGIKANLPIRLVAAAHDTSVVMIERHYSKWITSGLEDMARAAIVPLMPSADATGKVCR